MEPTLQEIADAAVRDFEARTSRRGRTLRTSHGAPRVAPKGTIRIARTIEVKAEKRQPAPRPTPGRPAPRVPIRRYAALFAAGLVLLAAGTLTLAWARASAGWEDDARRQRRELIMQQGMSLHAQIKTLSAQADRLEEKARTLLQYSTDLRYSFQGRAGDEEIAQADAALADRRRLLAEIAARRRQLAELRRQSSAPYARP